MKKSGIVLSIVLMLAALLLNISPVAAATDGFYNLSELNQPAWDGTEASRTKAPTADYDYTYGDEASVTYTLPWSFSFYGQSYRSLRVRQQKEHHSPVITECYQVIFCKTPPAVTA